MIRIILVALAFIVVTLLLLPLQLIGLAFEPRLQRMIPHLYHRILCALIGVRIREVGRRSTGAPALILSNHVSWLDICVITALAPVVFVAKSEVAGWPVIPGRPAGDLHGRRGGGGEARFVRAGFSVLPGSGGDRFSKAGVAGNGWSGSGAKAATVCEWRCRPSWPLW